MESWKVLCACFFVSMSGLLSEDLHAKPLLIRSFSLGNILRFTPPQPSATLVDKENYQLRTSYSVANLWGHGKGFMIDAQVDDSVLSSTWRLNERLSLNVGFARRVLRASNLDPLIVGFHDLFGFTQGERLSVPQDDSNLQVSDYQIHLDKKHINRAFNQQIFSSLNYLIPINETTGQWMIGLLTFYELTGGLSSQSGDFGEGLQTSFFRRSGNYQYHAGMTFMNYHSQSEYTKNLYNQQVMVNSAAIYDFDDSHNAGAQLLVGQGAFKQMGQLSKPTFEVHAMYQYKDNFGAIDLAIIENIFWPYNTPDFGWSVGLSYTSF